MTTPISYQDIYSEIKKTLLQSRSQAYSTVNFAMVRAYWEIGRIIVEHEQNGNLRSAYGKGVLQDVSARLQQEFGAGFSVRNLQQMKRILHYFSKYERTAFAINMDTLSCPSAR